ncbi:MAG: hypothetical protein A2Y10_04800 [Planctomycetes bacterium GWF2_41_51]|nr:MAG: hypothetical protein A2Y10_04800 [Planctomycetes bacterium GWF2_41_51]HBG26689.1 hypothetical protein [Phycisphaerales bacterium]
MRFGQNITGFINKFQVDTGPGVTGSTEETKPYLIIYDSEKERDILANFAEIIKTAQIPFSSDKGYFAISYRHDKLEKFADYSEKIAKNKNKKESYRYDTDIEYLDLITEDFIRVKGTPFVAKILLHLLYKHHKENGNSWSKLKNLLRNSDKADNFKRLIIAISNDILLNKSIIDLDKLKEGLNEILGEDAINFTRSNDSNNLLPNSTTASDNIFTNSDGIKIKLGTIHSIKGQTHDATLLFSSKEGKKQDIQHVFDNTPKLTPKYKKLLYVAASRPKYLFAFAIEKNKYDTLTDKSIFKDFTPMKIGD